MMNRGDLTNDQSEQCAPLLPPPESGPGATGRRSSADRERHPVDPAHRGAVAGLARRYGAWQTVASRFYRWRKAGLWDRLFAAVQQHAEAAGEIDWSIHFVDSTIVRAHQHAAGARGTPNRSLRPQPRRFQHQSACPRRRQRQVNNAGPDTRAAARCDDVRNAAQSRGCQTSGAGPAETAAPAHRRRQGLQ